MENQDWLYKIRHSLAHVMAQAVLELRPHSQLGFGPPIEDGFYYDFILSSPLTEADFPEIESRMRRFIQQGHPFVREELAEPAALNRLESMGEPYKTEYAQKELFKKQNLKTLSFYQTGPFLDMCEGPHVDNTQQLPLEGFKLKSLAGAYWRGQVKNPMMTRIYAWAFASAEDLTSHLMNLQKAQARDHKKLGKELEIFILDEAIGKGLPLWLPHGTVLRDELEKLMKELEFQGNYQRVATPHLARTSLYYQTGHLPYYAQHMYPFMEIKETLEGTSETSQALKEAYCLKPMNCPHHHRIYACRPRSYRELPLRLAEYGQVYRLEDSGALSGLLRVRGLCMNDAHIYCTASQLKQEFLEVMHLHRQVYEILQIKDYRMRLSTWDPEDPHGQEKYVNQPEAWEWTQKLIYEAMQESGLPFTEGLGEAAFYGPKIDVQLKTVTGREETASTNQLDFAIPERMNLTYTGPDNREHRPFIIHRAPLGTHERFVAFLIEHFGGAFPTWLAPIQVRLLTVSEKFTDYGKKVLQVLRQHQIRAELDDSAEKIGKKIKNAIRFKIPHLLILGEKEQSHSTVTWRQRGPQDQQQTLPLEAFQTILLEKIRTRSPDSIHGFS